jgi:hypothetical protein
MFRMPRASFFFLVASMVAWLVACAAGNPSSDPAATDPTAAPEPTAPPTATTPTTPVQPPKKDPDEALPPEVYSVTPDKATVGGVGPSIVVAGNNFVPRSIVQLDGAPLATSFVSGTELRATIPTGKLAAVGTLRLSVGTSPPGGGASKEVTFQVQNPAATLTQLSPLSVVAGSPATQLHVTGSGFAKGATVYFGSTALVTTYTSTSELDATIPAALLTTSSSVPVKVNNPAPGGGDSTTISFTIANPSASIQTISPDSAYVGGAGFTMTVIGSGFVAGSAVKLNGALLATTFVNATQLTATVPASALNAVGDFPVAVNNPPPGGGVSVPVVFHVRYPVPSALTLTPSSANAGASPTDVVVGGTGFFPASQITFDGAPAATTYQDGNHVKATLTAAQLATGGTISVRVVNPAPGGGVSSALSFTVNNPSPSITSLNPSSVVAGSPDKTITITGTGFLPTSAAKSNGVLLTTTYVSGTQLSAVVPSSQLLNPGSVAITVTNPAPGGGTSAPATLSIGCDTSGVDVALGPVGNVTTLTLNFAAAAKYPVFTDNGTGSCASTTLDPAYLEPARYYVVQNTAGVPVTLSAWAVCTADGKQDDAFLTFYKRPTPPANDTERLACFSWIAEGVSGSAGKSSPESGASMYCPGLTKANGGGMTLAVCEKAVVHIQAYSLASATYPPPPQLRLKPE